MDFNGSQKFNVPPQQVWNALMNPTVLKACIPGAEDVTVTANQIHFKVHVGLPILSGDFDGVATIVSQTPPTHAVLNLDRSGSHGSVKGDVTIDLAPDGAGTNLTYNAKIAMTGQMGMIDNPIGQQGAKSALNTFFKNLETKV